LGNVPKRRGDMMIDKMRQLMEMQRKIQEIKRQLDNTFFEISSSDGLAKVTMNGSQEVKMIVFTEGALETDEAKTKLEEAAKDAYNRAIKHSQKIAAEKMKDAAGLNLPGLF